MCSLIRLWSLHPSLLDRAGLVALWRDALLAQKVRTGTTKGYRHRRGSGFGLEVMYPSGEKESILEVPRRSSPCMGKRPCRRKPPRDSVVPCSRPTLDRISRTLIYSQLVHSLTASHVCTNECWIHRALKYECGATSKRLRIGSESIRTS